MEHISLTFKATRQLPKPVQIGVVASGDLEVLFKPATTGELQVKIITSQENSEPRWKFLFERIIAATEMPAGELIIHDSAATPGVARLRIEQAFEESEHE